LDEFVPKELITIMAKYRNKPPQLAGGTFVSDPATGECVAYFMVNCGHVADFEGIFERGNRCSRILGVKANASMKSHGELDESERLEEGDRPPLS
jgi:hypothetical protein